MTRLARKGLIHALRQCTDFATTCTNEQAMYDPSNHVP